MEYNYSAYTCGVVVTIDGLNIIIQTSEISALYVYLNILDTVPILNVHNTSRIL